MKNCCFFLTQISVLTIILLGKDFIKSFFLIVTINETNPFLNLQKAIVGGIVAAVIVTGDKVTDTECEMGYVKVDNVCVDMCDGINCGIGGDCLSGNCTCQTGYINVGNFCEETCALTPCKELVNLEQKIGILKNGSYLMNLTS